MRQKVGWTEGKSVHPFYLGRDKMKKIGIIGSRRRNTEEDYKVIYNEFKKWYENGDIIVSGGCKKGGDKFAEIIARKMNLTEKNGKLIIHRPKPVPRNSPKYEYAKANYKRNTLIANDSDILIACVAPDRKGGTEDTIRKWERRKLNRNFLKII
jgi:hypothetical protein